MKTPHISTKRVLVVEDEPSISQVCLRILTAEGFDVDLAVNARVAQDMIEEQQYDLCLVDVRTPEMNGEELYQWLEEKHPQLLSKLIFTSGSVMEENTQRFLEQCARPFLPKPFAPDELKAIVRKATKEIT